MEFNERLSGSDSLGEVAADLIRAAYQIVRQVEELEVGNREQAIWN